MKVIECLGMARAGKTTQICALERFLTEKGKSVRIIWDRERAKELATPPDQPMAYQIVFFGKVIDEYYRALQDGVEYLIIDRGFQDALVWADVLCSMGVFTDEQSSADKKCFECFRNFVDQTFYFTVPIDIAMRRHQSTEHQVVDDVAMNASWLSALEKGYKNHLSALRNVLTIDGMAPEEDVQALIRENLI